MQILQGSVNFLLSLGAAIFVPFIIIVAGLLVRMRVKDAVSAGITLGVAFSGMTMLISYMTAAITPAAQAMSETVGVDLPITDGGWTTMSTISWSWPYAFLMFPPGDRHQYRSHPAEADRDLQRRLCGTSGGRSSRRWPSTTSRARSCSPS